MCTIRNKRCYVVLFTVVLAVAIFLGVTLSGADTTNTAYAADDVAIVTYGSTTESFTTFEAAWNCAVTNGISEETRATVQLLANVTADSAHSFGTGAGFGSNGYIFVPGGKYITLDLNNKTIDRAVGDTAISNGYVISVEGNLILDDSGTVGAITGGNNSSSGGGVYIYEGTFTMSGGTIRHNYTTEGGGGAHINSGTFTMEGGTIRNNTASKLGGGVQLMNGTHTMSGGTIRHNTAKTSGGGAHINSGTFTMSGGTIRDNTATECGGGLYVVVSVFNMNGGEISSNTATKNGGGIFVGNGSTFTMRGSASISNNKATENGGGVSNEGTFSMTDNAVITGNTAANGGGVEVHSNTFTMSGNASINNNTAESEGGGVYVTENGTSFTMSNGTISGNTASSNGGGVLVTTVGKFVIGGTASITGNNTDTSEGGGVYVINNSTINLSGDANITGNVKGGSLNGNVYTGGTANNVYLYYFRFITISDNDESTSPDTFTGNIGVSMKTPGTITSGWGSSTGTITSDDEAYLIGSKGSELELGLPVAKVTNHGAQEKYLSFEQAWNYAVTNGTDEDDYVTVQLLANVTADSAHSFGTGAGFGIIGIAGYNTGNILVPEGKYITIDLNNYRINRAVGATAISDGYVIRVAGNLILNDNSESKNGAITGGNDSFGGGGVYVLDFGTFTMSGGTISGNTAGNYGGGIFVSDNGTFTMSGGTISGNTAGNYGGGVYVNGTINLSGNANITGNVKGGTISGGVLSGGTANNVYLFEGKTICISDNDESTSTDTFSSSGSIGVSVSISPTTSTFAVITRGWGSSTGTIASDNPNYMIDTIGSELALGPPIAEVTYNEVSKKYLSFEQAWNIAVSYDTSEDEDIDATVKLLADITAENKSFGTGAGFGTEGYILVPSGKYITLDLNYNTIDRVVGATAISDGYVVRVEGDLLLTDNSDSKYGTITGGNTTGDGGGIYVFDSGMLTLRAGCIDFNSANNGGGVAVRGRFYMAGGYIARNIAKSNGGGVANVENGMFYMSGGNIFSNRAVDNGGGVYIPSNSNYTTFSVSANAVIRENLKSDNSSVNNLYLQSGEIEIKEAFSGSIGVTIPSTTAVVITSGWGSSTGRINPDNSAYLIGTKGSELVLGLPVAKVTNHGTTTKYLSFEQAWNYAVTNGTDEDDYVTVQLLADITAENKSFGTGVGFGDGYSSSTGNIFVPSSAYVSLDLNGFTIDRAVGDTAINGGYVIKVEGNLILTDSGTTGTITGGNNTGHGGGVNIEYNRSVLTMNGGTISGNKAKYGGGASLNGDSFFFNGGTISGNTASNNGGGVYVETPFSVSGSGTITDNFVGDDSTPNNVYISSSYIITIYSGSDDGDNTFSGSIGVSMATPGPITNYWVSSGSTGTISSDNTYYAVGIVESEKVLAVAVASVSINGEITRYTTFEEAWNYAVAKTTNDKNRATVQLLANVTADSATHSFGTGAGFGTDGYILVPSDKYITLDLNGYTIDRAVGDTGILNGYVINVAGNLILTDNSSGKNGTITGGNSTTDGGGVYVTDTGTFTIDVGTISGNTAKNNGGGIYISDNGTFTLNSGEISGNTVSLYGGGVYVTGVTAKFTMRGGTIKNNTAASEGGGVYVESTFNLSGSANITGNVKGGTISEGVLSGGTANNVYLKPGKIITISDNDPTTDNDSFTGTIGVSMETLGTVTSGWGSSNGTVIPDDSRYLVGTKSFELMLGIPVVEVTYNGITTKYSSFEQAWNIAVSYGTSEAEDNDATVKLLADITAIPVDTNGDDEVDSTSFGTGSGFGYFGSFQDGDILGNSGNMLVPNFKYITLDLNGFDINRDLNETKSYGFVIYVEGNLTLTDTSSGASGKLTGSYSLSGSNGCIRINSAGTVIMNGGEISGNTLSSGGGVYVNGGTFIMNDGTITGNSAISGNGGGGVYIYEGTFTMNGGAISGNIAYKGGGVVVGFGATFTMNGGIITGNNAYISGGGVYVLNRTNNTFNLSGDADITENVKGGSQDGAVYTGGTANNVYLESDKIITISDNDPTTDEDSFTGSIGVTMQTPGPITNYWGSTDTITSDNIEYAVGADESNVILAVAVVSVSINGEITRYTTFEEAWNYAVTNGTDEDDYVTVQLLANVTADSSDTHSFGTGAGFGTNGFISVPSGTSITLDLNGYKIDRAVGDTGILDGYVINVAGNLILTDNSSGKNGTITGGNSTTDGGGVCVSDTGTFTMNGGTISGNTAGEDGGGVYVQGTFVMNVDSHICENSASNGGGLYCFGTATMKGGTITGNNASECGGGVYVNSSFTMMRDSIILGNNAEESGGGVYDCGTLNLNGESNISGNVKGGTKEDQVYTGGTANNVYLTEDTTITVNDNDPTTPSDTFNGTFGVTTQISPTLTDSVDVINWYYLDDRIISDNSNCYMQKVDDKIVLSAIPVTITFRANYDGTTESHTQIVAKNLPTTLDSNNLSKRADYRFNKWNTQSDGLGSDYADNESVTFATDTDLYAVWTEKTTVNINEVAQAAVYYSGTGITYNITGTHGSIGDFVINYYVDSAWTTTTPINAGSYDVKITRAYDDYYKAYEKTITDGLTISIVTLTPFVSGIIGKDYDGNTDASGTISLSGAVNGESPTATATFAWTSSDANTATVNVSGIALGSDWNANYKLSTNSLPSKSFGSAKISQKQLTISGSSITTKDYDGDNIATVVNGTVGGVIGSDVVIVTPFGLYEDANAGTNKSVSVSYVLSGADCENYLAPVAETLSGAIDKIYYDMTDAIWVYSTPFTYNGNAQAISVAGLPTGVTVNDYVNNSKTDVGTYTASVTFSFDTTNYFTPSLSDKEWQITAKTAELSWADIANLVYNKTAKTTSASVTNLEDGDECTVEVELTAEKNNVNVGTFTYTATSLSNTNYKLPASVVSGEYTIIAKTAELSWADIANLVYNKTAKTTSASVTNLEDGDECTVEVELTAEKDNVNVGTFTYTATSLSNTNYKLPASVVSGDYTITAKTAELSWADISNLVYNKTAKTTSATVTNLEDGDECTVEVELTAGKDNVNVGTFTYTATSLSNVNYKLPASAVSGEYTITAKTAELSWANIANLVYNKTAKTTSASVTNLEDGDECTVEVELTAEKDNVNVGTFTYTATSLSNTNYNLPVSVVSGEYTITAMDITVTADDKTSVHKLALVALTYSFSPSLCEGDTFTGSLATDADNMTVAEYDITQGTLSAGNNYNVAFIGAKYEITLKAAVSITQTEQEYGYDETAKSFEIGGTELTGFNVQYFVDDNYTATAPVNAGSYKVKVTRDEDSGYYAFSVEITDGLIILTQKVAKPAENMATFTYSGVNQIYALTADDRYTISEDSRTDAGNQTVTVALIDTENYEWVGGGNDNLTFNFTIGQKELTVTADDQSMTYGDAIPTYTVSYSGFVNGETADVLDTKPTAASTYAITTSVQEGPLAVTASGGADDNYSFTYVDGSLTVSKATPTTSAQTITATYGDVLSQATGLENGYTLDQDGSGTVGTVSEPTGSLTATFTPSDGINYSAVTGITVTLTVNAQKVAIPEEDDTVFIEDATQKTYNVVADDRYTVSGNARTTAGTYDVVVALNDTLNYEWSDGTIEDLSFVFIIRQSNLSAKADQNSEGNSIIITTAGGFSPDTTVSIKNVTANLSSEMSAYVDAAEELIGIYDVNLLVNGLEVQPDSTITIKLLIPSECEGKNFRIMNVRGDSVEFVVDGAYAVISTDSLTGYVFIVDRDVASLLWLIILLAIILLIEVILAIIKYYKDKDKKKQATTYSIMPLILAVFIPAGQINAVIALAVMVVIGGAFDTYIYLKKGKELKKDDSTASNSDEDTQREDNLLTGSDASFEKDDVKRIAEEVSVNETQYDDDDDDETSVLVRFKKSFTAKLIQSSDETKGYYGDLKNALMSYKKVNSRISWCYDSLNKGRTKLAKLTIRGKTLCLYLALNAEEYDDSKYKVENDDIKKYEDTPCLYRIKNDRRAKYALELIDLLGEKHGLIKGETQTIDYYQPYDSTENLISRGLIKEIVGKEEYDEYLLKQQQSEEDNGISDSASAHERVQIEGKIVKAVVNIDSFSDNYSAGETVNLDSLKEKKLLKDSVNYYKVLARGTLDKPLTVEANEISGDAEIKILEAGGKVILL